MFEKCDSAIYKHNMFKKCPRDCCFFLGNLVSPKINNIDFGRSGHVQKSPNYENEGLGPLK